MVRLFLLSTSLTFFVSIFQRGLFYNCLGKRSSKNGERGSHLATDQLGNASTIPAVDGVNLYSPIQPVAGSSKKGKSLAVTRVAPTGTADIIKAQIIFIYSL
jgi:hypothetical protein